MKTLHLNLSSFYKQMKQQQLCLHGFKFEFRGVRFDVLFEIYQSPFKLIILQLFGNFEIILNVNTGFAIDTYLPYEKYCQLCEILGLKKDPNNPFSPLVFFENLNSKIPNTLPTNPPVDAISKYYKDSIEEADKIFYRGHTNWNVKGGGNVTEKNLKKTLRLHGKVFFEICKRNNISIHYTSTKGLRTISELYESNVQN